MGKKPVFLVVFVGVAAAAVGALVAYRLGLRHSATAPSPPSLASVNKKGDCINFRDAGSHTGETCCISGQVLRVFTSRAGNVFLDFCSDYRSCPFTSVVFASDRSKFGDLGKIAGQRIEIRGLISVYQGRPEIVVHDPEQLRVVSEE